MTEEKKKLPKTKKPSFLRFTIPVINTLKDLGGSGLASEVQDAIIEQYDIPASEVEAVNKNGGSKIRNQIAWVRFYLTKSGIIDSSKRGVWALTEKGISTELTPEQVHTLFKEVQGLWGGGKKSNDMEKKESDSPDPTDDEPEEYFLDKTNYRVLLAQLLQSKLSPNGFEMLCKRILRESGFTRVEVTGKSNDGGIDGIGILEINPLISFKVLFQCKRWKSSVPPKEIRDFRGAMDGRADKGIFLTTGTFSQEARKEATRDGAVPIELVDLDKLIEMLEKLELGLIQKKTYEIDAVFFENYIK